MTGQLVTIDGQPYIVGTRCEPCDGRGIAAVFDPYDGFPEGDDCCTDCDGSGYVFPEQVTERVVVGVSRYDDIYRPDPTAEVEVLPEQWLHLLPLDYPGQPGDTYYVIRAVGA